MKPTTFIITCLGAVLALPHGNEKRNGGGVELYIANKDPLDKEVDKRQAGGVELYIANKDPLDKEVEKRDGANTGGGVELYIANKDPPWTRRFEERQAGDV